MRRGIHFKTAFLFLLTGGKLIAQDIHFSQIHASPTHLNPSLTGLFNSEYRVIANYKNQWKSVSANYNTYFASLDGKVLYLPNKNFISAGLQVYSDKAGDLNFSKKEASLSVSVVKSLSQYFENYLCIGAQGGVINQSVDYSRVHLLDSEPDPSLQNNSSGFAFDLNAGMTWYMKTRKFLFYAGGAVHHLNKPDISISDQSGTTEILYTKYVMHGGAEFGAFDKRVLLMPSFISLWQGPYRETNIGGYVRHKLMTGEENQRRFFYYGAWFRWYYSSQFNSGADAMILSVRLDNNAFSYAFSYDLTVSSLSAQKTTGSPEISIIYLIDAKVASVTQKSKQRKITCPIF